VSEASEIERYLGQLSGEGELKSQGRFTLDFQKALEKLGVMASQHVHRWVFFACQAAVAYGASEMRISHNREAISVQFWLEHQPPSLLDGHSFQSVEEKPDLRGDAAADQCLRQALLWGRALSPSQFKMAVLGPHPGYLLTTTEAGMQYLPQDQAAESRTSCTLALWLPRRLADEMARLTSSLEAEATYRLSFSPLPVYLQSQLLSAGDASQLMRNRKRREGNVKLWERYILTSSPPGEAAIAVVHPRLQPASTYHIEGRPPVQRKRSCLPPPTCYHLEFAGPEVAMADWTLDSQPSGLTVAQWQEEGHSETFLNLAVDPQIELAAFDSQRVRSRAIFTRMRVTGNYLVLARHGMLLDPISLEGLPYEGWVAVVASNLVNTDASGLSAVRDERVERLIQWFQAEVFAIHARVGPV
jgi:hypothetical protein